MFDVALMIFVHMLPAHGLIRSKQVTKLETLHVVTEHQQLADAAQCHYSRLVRPLVLPGEPAPPPHPVALSPLPDTSAAVRDQMCLKTDESSSLSVFRGDGESGKISNNL